MEQTPLLTITSEEAAAIEKFAQAQKEWSAVTFGDAVMRGPVGALRHLVKEIDEEVRTEKDHEKLKVEIADMLFLILDAAWRAGVSVETMCSATPRTRLDKPLLDAIVEQTQTAISTYAECVRRMYISAVFQDIILFASINCMSVADLLSVAFAKLEVNKARTWPAPTPGDQPVEHDRSKDSVCL
jgi:hypothetical protein